MPSEKSSVKEMSRFIKQLQYDWKTKNPALDWHEPMIRFDVKSDGIAVTETKIEKNELVLDLVKANLGSRGLSPSSIAMFATCSLKYYYSQILNLRKDKEAEDEMGADVFGTWVHKVLEIVDEEILTQHAGWYDQANVSERLASLDQYLDRAMQKIQAREGVYELEKGFNFVLKEVAKTILEQYYQTESTWAETRLQLVAIERKFIANVNVLWQNEELPIKLTGRIDRLDRMGNTYRIIDYKTGKVDKKDLAVSDLGLMDTLTSANLKAKLLQLWFYKFLFAAEMKQPSDDNAELFVGLSDQDILIQPGIISFRNLAAQVLHEPNGLWFSEGQDLDAFKSDSEVLISTWVHRILDASVAFEKTKDIANCQFCDFKVICHREV
jgi:RecB family exonuclease